MEKQENVLSLFNGMGCVWLALEEAGVKVGKRYSSEIEKYPNHANDTLYPDTIQLGDVRNVDVSKLEPISFIAGGSPCQSFSFAGKRKGMATKCEIEILSLEHYIELKEQNFEFEGQSYLFWEYIRIITDIRKYNPDVKFLLENVIMGAKWQKVITQAIGINPIRINAALVSAQSRDRLFWTNIYTEQQGLFGDLKCMIPQPKDQGILLKDILETDVADKYFLSEKMLNWLNRHSEKRGTRFKQLDGFQKGSCVTTTANIKQNLSADYIVHNTMPRSSKTGKGGTGPLSQSDGKTYCLDTGNTNAVEIQCVAMRGRDTGAKIEQQIEPRNDGKTNCLTSVQKDNLVMQINPSKESGGKQPFQHNRVYDTDGISPCLSTDSRPPAIEVKSGTLRTHKDGQGFREVVSGKGATVPARAREDGSGQNVVFINNTIRRLTPRECGRLQSIPEDKLDILLNCGISDTQIYKMFGNGWNIKVIVHILSYFYETR